MAVSAKISLKFEGTITRAAVLGVAPAWPGSIEMLQAFADGTTANKADLFYMAERTVASATNDDIDLAGVLTDAFGATITAAKLVALGLVNKQLDGTANTTNLTPGGATNFVPGFSAALWAISPGGCFAIVSPGTTTLAIITAGTADILRIANSSGATNKYMIGILARSA